MDLKFDSIYIPIIHSVQLPGNTPQADPPLGTIPGTDESHFNASKISGVCVPSELYYPIPSTVVTSGATDFHDSSVMLVGDPVQYSTYHIAVPVTIKRGEQIVYYDPMFEVCMAWTGPANQKIETGLYAVEYDYPNATTEPGKVKSYKIFGVYKVTRYNDQGEVISESYQGLSDFLDIPIANLNERFGLEMYYDGEIEPNEDPFEDSTPMPYNPTIDDTSDTIDLPSDPTVGVIDAGFINVYNPGPNTLAGLGDVLFPQITVSTDVAQMLWQLTQVLANQNLINYVIDCHVIPVAPVVSGASNIKVGYNNTGISAPNVASDYVNFSCGSLSIAEYFSGFQDYQGTRSKIYLPFIGFVDTKPEFWQAGTISVDYKFNVIDGSFMCYIRSTSSKSQLSGSVIAQYSGNACMHFPLTGVNYSSMVSGIVGASIAAASAGSASPALGAAWSAANSLAQGGNVQQSNGYNSTSALLGVRVPYLMIERVCPAYPTNYSHDKGFPSNISTNLAFVYGFTIIEDIDLSGIPLTQEELEELRGLLKEGVYF